MLDKFEISKFVSETGQVGASVEQLASDSRCFVGFSGRWSKDSRNGGSVDEYLGFVPQGNPIHGFFTRGTGSSPKSLQLIGPAETDIYHQLYRSTETTTGLAGSIWEVDGACYQGEASILLGRFKSILNKADQVGPEDALKSLSDITGDFAFSAMSSEAVLLVRCLPSTNQLYYRIDGDSICWSTSFLDLVDRPIGDLNVEKLVLLSWGLHVIPYNGINSLSSGEYLYARGSQIKVGRFDEYKRSDPPKRLSPFEWANLTREILYEAVKKRVRPYSRVGLALSAGIDSSAVAACLAECGSNVMIYNWAGGKENPAIDESDMALKTAKQLGMQDHFRFIDASSDHIRGGKFIDEDWELTLPFTNNLYKWWFETFQLASEDGIQALIGGRFAYGIFCGRRGLSLGRDLRSIPLRFALRYLSEAFALPMSTKSLLQSLSPASDLEISSRDLIEGFDPDAMPKDREVWHYTDWARDVVVSGRDEVEEVESLQSLNIDIELGRPRGIVRLHPYNDRKFYEMLKWSIPDGYRHLPCGGRLLPKPILRLAFLDRLPKEVVRDRYQANYGAAKERWIRNNKEVVLRILSSESYLAKFGIINTVELESFWESRVAIPKCAGAIAQNILLELWLRTVSDFRR